MTAAFEARHLVHGYHTGRNAATPVVDGVTLSAEPGEIVGITGRSGAGKSTLLRLIAGIERPDRGSIAYDDQLAWEYPAGWWRRAPRHAHYPRPAYAMPVFQDAASSLDPRWPIWRSLTEGILRSASAPERRTAARDLLQSAAMGHVDVASRPTHLSGGQCQRVAVLRALAAQPALIVADEPTARQDVITARAISRLLADAAEGGAAILIVSHNADWLGRLAHRVLRMHAGTLD